MKKLILALLMIVLLSSMVIAPMPPSHNWQNDYALLKARNSPVGSVVSEYWQDYQACDVLTDISVFLYFSEGFSSIGTEYKATHSKNLCEIMIELHETPEQLACAYGVCAHHVQDAHVHNEIIPPIIRQTGLSNGLVHALIEQNIDNAVATQENKNSVATSLLAKAPVHKEFFRKALMQQGKVSSLKFDAMYDTFVDQVVGGYSEGGSGTYDVGFRAFTAIPTSIHIILMIFVLFNFMVLAYLVTRQNKNIFAKIAMGKSILFIVIVLFLYVAFFMGKIWVVFQFVANPISALLPIGDQQTMMIEAGERTVAFWNSGVSYIRVAVADPSGADALMSADASGSLVRNLIMLITLAMTALMIYLAVRKKKR